MRVCMHAYVCMRMCVCVSPKPHSNHLFLFSIVGLGAYKLTWQRMARILREELGERLHIEPNIKGRDMPSPNELRGRILVKVSLVWV